MKPRPFTTRRLCTWMPALTANWEQGHQHANSICSRHLSPSEQHLPCSWGSTHLGAGRRREPPQASRRAERTGSAAWAAGVPSPPQGPSRGLRPEPLDPRKYCLPPAPQDARWSREASGIITTRRPRGDPIPLGDAFCRRDLLTHCWTGKSTGLIDLRPWLPVVSLGLPPPLKLSFNTRDLIWDHLAGLDSAPIP